MLPAPPTIKGVYLLAVMSQLRWADILQSFFSLFFFHYVCHVDVTSVSCWVNIGEITIE